MDVWKLVIIVVLLAILLFFIGQLNDLNVFSATGNQALDQLATPSENSYGVAATWSPVDIGRDLFAGLFATFDIWAILTGAFAAALIVVGISILIKIIGKVTGS